MRRPPPSRRPDQVFAAHRAAIEARLAPVAGAALTAMLAGCSPDGGADQPAVLEPPGPHIRVSVDASKDTHYEMLCDIRTFEVSPEKLANRYGLDTTGPYSDVIPSRSAHCTARIDSGPAPIRVTLSKSGVTQSMTIDTVGDAGKRTLHMW
jgi:hypothetical protein